MSVDEYQRQHIDEDRQLRRHTVYDFKHRNWSRSVNQLLCDRSTLPSPFICVCFAPLLASSWPPSLAGEGPWPHF